MLQATSVEEALDVAAVRPPEAAIIDLMLPDGDGIDITRALREWSELPILVLSAVGEDDQKVAIIKRVIAIERHFAEHGPDSARVLTERDMRRATRGEPGRPWTVGIVRERGRRGRRWADYAVETPEGRTAVEREFSMKGTSRLRSIVRGYLESGAFDYVDFVVLERDQDLALARLLTRLLDEERAADHAARLPGVPVRVPTIRVVSWRDPLPHVHAGLDPFAQLPIIGSSDARP